MSSETKDDLRRQIKHLERRLDEVVSELHALSTARMAMGKAVQGGWSMDAPIDDPDALAALLDMLEDFQDPSGIRLWVGEGDEGYGLYVSSLCQPTWPARRLHTLAPPAGPAATE